MSDSRGFTVRHDGMETIPTMVCEKCGEAITDYRMAGVVWVQEKFKNGSRSRVIVLCKTNKCLSTPPQCDLPWMEMRDYMLWMAHNVGLKTESHIREAWKITKQA
jgi:hypothetical protein